MKKVSSQCLGEKGASYTDFMERSKIFVAHCYGMTEVTSSTNRFDKKIQRFFLYYVQNKKLSVKFFGGCYAERKGI